MSTFENITAIVVTNAFEIQATLVAHHHSLEIKPNLSFLSLFFSLLGVK